MKIDDTYCLINFTLKSQIVLCVFKKNYQYPICLVSNSSTTIYLLIDLHDIFRTLSLSHILYLSKELYKAELSLFIGQKYVQN